MMTDPMKPSRLLLLFVLPLFIISCYSPVVIGETSQVEEDKLTAINTQEEEEEETKDLSSVSTNEGTSYSAKNLPEPLPNPYQMPEPYNCEMTIEFTSGPLQSQKSTFTVLDKSYFEDKGDKFSVGKGTGIYYQGPPYFILHSSYVNGNILKPMEAEFIRKHLEHWGNKDEEYISNQIKSLVGSQVSWFCDGELFFDTEIGSIARLSHEASERLWLEPQQIEDILAKKEGVASEWVGEITSTDNPSFYLGFCGWGPTSLESVRYTYYRYLLSFTIHTP